MAGSASRIEYSEGFFSPKTRNKIGKILFQKGESYFSFAGSVYFFLQPEGQVIKVHLYRYFTKISQKNPIGRKVWSVKVNFMNIYCIACGVFRNNLERLSSSLPDGVEIRYLEGGLHTNPGVLRKELQLAIDQVPREYERIILLYGTCGKGVVGVSSSHCEILIPRVHDCISLFLGGTEEYRKQFSHKPGTYYISAGWYEEQVQPKGKKSNAEFPKEYVDTTDPGELLKRYGQENTGEIREFFNSWKKNYTRAVYIHTGERNSDKYESYARNMAEKLGWEYTRLEGSDNLIRKCFEPRPEGDDIVIIPKGRKIIFDPVTSSVAADTDDSVFHNLEDRFFTEAGGGTPDQDSRYSLGLGIDAGGTYTDAVLYSFDESRVLSKAKALTTKWKYSQGIMNAVQSLPPGKLKEVDLISISTTLVTNAIVESNTRPVGLLVMPPGRLGVDEIDHTPTRIIRGRMSIDGTVLEEIDPEEVRKAALEMVTSHGVSAFAVSGYGGSVNPELELQVKEQIRSATGLDVCCGHELSGSLNFYVRARTAVLNAGTIPIMEEFLSEMRLVLDNEGLRAPMLVVRGDGSVMTGSYASDFPVQTALSGPAASMAGARHLAGLDNALVADVGGTTTDIGFLEKGKVSVCDEGAHIGSWKTHVRAVDMHTVGLGGDSEILFDRRLWSIGPRRITPFTWLDEKYDVRDHLRTMAQSQERWEDNLQAFQWLCLSGKEPDFALTPQEKRILDALCDGPVMVKDLGILLCEGVWKALRTARLEQAYCLIRSGLTPTDLFHLDGRLSLWDSPHMGEYFSFISQISGMDDLKLLSDLKSLISRKGAKALLGRIFPGQSGEDQETLLNRGNSRATIQVKMSVPVIGLGAPASLVLEEGVEQIGGTLVLPEHGDVANAVGAVISRVSVSEQIMVVPTPAGFYKLTGIAYDGEEFREMEEAEEKALQLLRESLWKKGREAGTSSRSVTISITNRIAEAAGGEKLFLERILTGELEGVPDLV